MFRGTHLTRLDEKGRLKMPAEFKREIDENYSAQFYITSWDGRSAKVYPMQAWEEIERKLVKLPSFNKQARRLQRLLMGHATECELDGAGRILVPPPLREFAGLNKAVILIGQGNKFEIWDEAAWNARRAEWLAETDEDGTPPADLESLSL